MNKQPASGEYAIRIKNLSKFYHIDTEKDIRVLDAIANFASGIIKPAKPAPKTGIWALNDINLDLNKGDVLGILGRNGSGKSTFLKVLSEITEPTKGEIEINGSIASILEIGMGFHHDLSGKDNIYQSSRILGFSKSDIKEQLNDIISFSGLEKFADTPIKYYSSGMYIRLAFSIVTHVKSEILLLDEVLSVGDAEFRIKCQKRIKELISEGRTVVFVSHNPSDIMMLCNKAMIMEEGRIKYLGYPVDVISRYNEVMLNLSMEENVQIRDSLSEEVSDNTVFLNEPYTEEEKKNEITYDLSESSKEVMQEADNALEKDNESVAQPEPVKLKPKFNYAFWDSPDNAPGNENIKFNRIIVRAKGKRYTERIFTDDYIIIEIDFWNILKKDNIMIGIGIIDNTNNTIFGSTPVNTIRDFQIDQECLYCCECELPANFMNEGSFKLEIVIIEENKKFSFFFNHTIAFKVNKKEAHWPGEIQLPGSITPPLKWKVQTSKG